MDLRLLGSVYLTLFVIMDPPGIIPVFLALTARRGAKAMARAALQAALTAFGVITLFAIFGERILAFLGITLPALQASGGLLLLIISLELLTGNTEEPTEVDDVNVAMVPLGTPLLAGPGAIVATILFVRQSHTAPEITALVLGIVAIHVTIYLVMRYSTVLARLLRPTGILVLTRIAGLLVAAIAVQLIANGVFGFIDARAVGG
ncbi:MAG: NAAT family transporter [Frankiales bacterium]|nr:NAAT family transporter [Frankiales bacterium]